MTEVLSWVIPAATCFGVGMIVGMDVAARMGPSYRWRWKHNCRCGEEPKP